MEPQGHTALSQCREGPNPSGSLVPTLLAIGLLMRFYRFTEANSDLSNSVIYSEDQLEGLDIQFLDPQDPLPAYIIEGAERLGKVEQYWERKMSVAKKHRLMELSLELIRLRSPELGLVATMSPGYKDKPTILDDIYKQQNR